MNIESLGYRTDLFFARLCGEAVALGVTGLVLLIRIKRL